MSNDGSVLALDGPSRSPPANRGLVVALPASTARLGQSLRLDEGSWAIVAGTTAFSGAPGFQLLARYGCGRGVFEETIQVPSRGIVFIKNADFIELSPSSTGVVTAQNIFVMGRKTSLSPQVYRKSTLCVPPSANFTCLAFATRATWLAAPGDTVQQLSSAGLPLGPPQVVPASGVLDFDLSLSCDSLQLVTAVTTTIVWECAS